MKKCNIKGCNNLLSEDGKTIVLEPPIDIFEFDRSYFIKNYKPFTDISLKIVKRFTKKIITDKGHEGDRYFNLTLNCADADISEIYNWIKYHFPENIKCVCFGDSMHLHPFTLDDGVKLSIFPIVFDYYKKDVFVILEDEKMVNLNELR